MVRWLRLCAPSAGGPGLIPGEGIRSHLPELRVTLLELKLPGLQLRLSAVKYINKYLITFAKTLFSR